MPPKMIHAGLAGKPMCPAHWQSEAVDYIHELAEKSRPSSIRDFDPVPPEIESGSCEYAVQIALAAVPIPVISATRRGTIQFEWECGPRYFEIEVGAQGAAEWFFSDESARTEQTGAISAPSGLKDIVQYIHRTVDTP